MKGNTTNTILVLILVAVVGFGVWYFTYRTADDADNGINIELGGGDSSY